MRTVSNKMQVFECSGSRDYEGDTTHECLENSDELARFT